MKFILNRNRKDGLEEKVITLYAAMNKIPFEYFNKPIDLAEGDYRCPSCKIVTVFTETEVIEKEDYEKSAMGRMHYVKVN